VHELEHAIQDLYFSPRHDLNPRLSTVDQFLAEKGAMIAEASYLLSIPQTEREGLRLAVRAELGAELPKRNPYLHLTHYTATNEIASSEDYVRWQWKNGRYSSWFFYTESFIKTGLFGIPSSYLLYLLF
jgi:hypothetical protein